MTGQVADEQKYPNPTTVGLWDAGTLVGQMLINLGGSGRPSVDGCHSANWVQNEKEILLWSVWKPCSISDWKVFAQMNLFRSAYLWRDFGGKGDLILIPQSSLTQPTHNHGNFAFRGLKVDKFLPRGK